MLDYRIKTLSAALACSTCLLVPLQTLAKDNDKEKTPPVRTAQPQPQRAPQPPPAGNSGNHGGGNPAGGGNPGFHAPSGGGGGAQFTQHGPANNGVNTHLQTNNAPAGGSHNFSTPQTPHTTPNVTPHPNGNALGANNIHQPGTQPHTVGAPNNFSPHNAVPNTPQTAHAGPASNALVHPAAPLVHPAGPLVHPAGGTNPGFAGHGPGAGPASPLGHAGSQAQIGQLNASRSNLHGINSKPLPAGEVSSHPNGSYSLHTVHGNDLGVRHDGSIASFSGHGESARFAANGHINALHTAGMDIHNVHGARFITTQRPDHSLLVSTGRHGGYLERPYAYGGHAYLERSYAWGGHVYNRYFYPYRYHGLLLAGAIAAYYYAPHFYGWAYDPWAAPVAYNWGWRSSPWYGYYNGYFTPAPSYVDGAAWLTDYSLSQNLSAAYDDSVGDGGPPQDDAPPAELGAIYSDGPAESYIAAPAATPITPELKAAITAEVRRQLAEEKAAAANPNAVSQAEQLQSAMQAGNVFIVSSNLNTNTPDQHTCVLTAGDTLQLQNPPGDTDSSAILRVASTKKGDCPANTNVQLTLQNLADMQNDLRMQIDSGLASLQENQGKNGLPPAPPDALAKPQAAVASNDAANTSDVQALLDAQRKQADQAEEQVSQSALSGS